ncbi:hypothetical protein NDU88_004055 [Pleurodeles waltl]|uniref:Uncharacterized protein n=1 Tax=Pleurodeles waltl TaxID=8319 RepID=A0AAV7WQT4_PLEWA|nr:hypothetical protein NDU88_004055 [Pleurodeles waltl]
MPTSPAAWHLGRVTPDQLTRSQVSMGTPPDAYREDFRNPGGKEKTDSRDGNREELSWERPTERDARETPKQEPEDPQVLGNKKLDNLYWRIFCHWDSSGGITNSMEVTGVNLPEDSEWRIRQWSSY